MDFAPSDRVAALLDRVREFMEEHVDPVEREAMDALDREVRPGVPYPEILVELRERAKGDGLWNLFLPDERFGPGLTNWEYGMLCELMGRNGVAPMVFNCAAPDTGNTEILAEHGTDAQHERWLQPLLDGEIRSCFSMTEPESAGSDPTRPDLARRARRRRVGHQRPQVVHVGLQRRRAGDRDGGHRPRRASAQAREHDPGAGGHARASRACARCRSWATTRAPATGRSATRTAACPPTTCSASAAEASPSRRTGSGPGRIHHCMRAIGSAERAFELMCRRAHDRQAFGGPLAEKQFVQDFIATSRMEIDQARLMVLHAAWRMDTEGKRAARQDISMIKVIAAQMHQAVLDRAMQVHGALGMSDDTPLAAAWRQGRWLRIADGPDEVHKMVIALRELNRFKPREPVEA